MSNCSITITTTDDLKVAKEIAEKLVEQDLAGCVWQDEVSSTYKWQGKIVTSLEYRLFIKSAKSKFTEISTIIKKYHNYDLPGIIEIVISDGDWEFLKWLGGNK